MLNEILILERLKHSNVLPFLGVCLQGFSPEADKSLSQDLSVKSGSSPSHGYGIVTPWLENGNILQYLDRNPSSNHIVKVTFRPQSNLLDHI